MMKPAAMPELGSQVVETMRKVRDTVYSVCSFHNVHFRGLVDEHELMLGESLLDSVDFLLTLPSYNFQIGCEDISSHYDVQTLQCTANAIAHDKQVIRKGAH